MGKVTLLIADDHRLLRECWSCILNTDGRFLVIDHTGDGVEAIRMVKNLNPDIVLMDINMKPLDGFEVTRQILHEELHTKVIGLSMYSNINSVKRLMALGARGYLTKNSSKEELIKAIVEVTNGSKYICDDIKNLLARHELEEGDPISLVKQLSKREIEIVQQLKMGFSSREIALLLDVGTKTVEVHRYNILKKLQVKNTASLINFFNVNGL